MRSAPLPSGSRRATHALPGTDQVTTSTSPNEVRDTTWWTAPGALTTLADYLNGHRPEGMSVESTGRSVSRTGAVASIDLNFETRHASAGAYAVNLDYVLAPYRSGVAIRVDTWTEWAPTRPRWSDAAVDAASVHVTIVRRSRVTRADRGFGAPTVDRTLTGAAARHLARAINRVPSVASDGVHSCPMQLVDASDTVVFATAAGKLTFVKIGGGCSFSATVSNPRDPGQTANIAGAAFEHAVLAALGLPSNYGYPR